MAGRYQSVNTQKHTGFVYFKHQRLDEYRVVGTILLAGEYGKGRLSGGELVGMEQMILTFCTRRLTLG